MTTTIDLRGIESITNDIYLPLYDNNSRYLVLYGGAGSGKSVFCATKILLRCITEKHKFLIVRKTARTLRNSCYSLIVRIINKWGLSKFFKIRRSDMTINFKNGSEILFMGIDDSEKIKSIADITSIWIEEASELIKNDFTQLDLRLRGETENYKQIMLSFNPISEQHWLKKHFFDLNIENATILKTTYKDNKFIDSEYIEILEKLKETNPIFYNIYALGEWGVLQGLVYNFEIVDEIPFDRIRSKAYGVDFGFNDPTAVVLCHFADNEVFIEELLYETGLITSEIIWKLNVKYPFLKKERGYFDSAEPDRIKEFKLSGYNVHESKKNIIDGINVVKKYKLKVLRGSDNLIKELNNYTWEYKGDVALDKPIDDFNHCLDAMRYAVASSPKPLAPFSYLNLNYKDNIAWI